MSTPRHCPGFEQFNLQDLQRLHACFEAHAPNDAVIHFAASKSVAESVAKPLAYYRNNLVSLMNLLEAMAAHGTGPIVFSSSCTVYGQPERLPVTEEARLLPAASPYGNTKRICEEILRDAAAAQPALGVISLRYFNPIGAHASGKIGELPRGVPNNLMPFITQTAAGVRAELLVFGSEAGKGLGGERRRVAGGGDGAKSKATGPLLFGVLLEKATLEADGRPFDEVS